MPRTSTAVAMLIIAVLGAPPTRAQTAVQSYDIRLEHGIANTPLIRVKQGDWVRLRWVSDRPIVLHLHGYDIERKVEVGAVAEMTFRASTAGRFPIEEHTPSAAGGHSHGDAPLVRIEVYPR
jgi:FtsP/CotA-like multicopper oxidase with cupredoxin domain